MVLNYIWVAFFVIAFIVALIKLLFMGNTEIFTELVNSTFTSSKTAFEISLGLTGILSLWLLIVRIRKLPFMLLLPLITLLWLLKVRSVLIMPNFAGRPLISPYPGIIPGMFPLPKVRCWVISV